MEMEPVSRHLGNHILRTNNKSSYCLFATNYLDMNVISDFQIRLDEKRAALDVREAAAQEFEAPAKTVRKRVAKKK